VQYDFVMIGCVRSSSVEQPYLETSGVVGAYDWFVFSESSISTARDFYGGVGTIESVLNEKTRSKVVASLRPVSETSTAGLLRVYIDKCIVMAIGCRDIDTVAQRTADTETNEQH
jgi:hypothetical protein